MTNKPIFAVCRIIRMCLCPNKLVINISYAAIFRDVWLVPVKRVLMPFRIFEMAPNLVSCEQNKPWWVKMGELKFDLEKS